MRLVFAALILIVLAVDVHAEDPWSFVVIADLVNNDVAIDDPDWFGDGLDGTFGDGTYSIKLDAGQRRALIVRPKQ